MGSEETGQRLGGGEEVMRPQTYGCHERRVMAPGSGTNVGDKET